MTLAQIIAVLDRYSIDPISLAWEHTPTRVRWTLYVARCAEFDALAAHWKGKRCDRHEYHGSRTLLAEVGELAGLLGHVCHESLPCWKRPADPEPTLLDALEGEAS